MVVYLRFVPILVVFLQLGHGACGITLVWVCGRRVVLGSVNRVINPAI